MFKCVRQLKHANAVWKSTWPYESFYAILYNTDEILQIRHKTPSNQSISFIHDNLGDKPTELQEWLKSSKDRGRIMFYIKT